MRVSTAIPETYTLQDLCRQILKEKRGHHGIPSGAMGWLIDHCQYFKLDPPVQIEGKEEEDIIAQCQDVARQSNVRMWMDVGDVVQGVPINCVHLFINLVGESMKIILS